jgi:type VI secretion system protein ImpH
MQAKKRLSEASVIQRLFDAPQRFQFVQAVRLLVRWMTQSGVSYDEALARMLRFQNSLSLNFPASEIEALRATPVAYKGDRDLERSLQEDESMRVVLVPTLIGLLGLSGALPAHKTDRIAAMLRREGDASARAFIDLFSQRMVAMFFQAWGKYRLEHRLDVEDVDGQKALFMALAGIGVEVVAGDDARGGIAQVASYYSALLRCRPVAASSMARVLTDHFRVPVAVEPFIAAWDCIPDKQLSRLGGKVASLGHGAALGRRLQRRDLRVRLVIGPLNQHEVTCFLPRSAGAVALAKMVALFGLPRLFFEVRLVLKPACIGHLVLGRASGTARRLGWDAFLAQPGGAVSRNTVAYLLRPEDTGAGAPRHVPEDAR